MSGQEQKTHADQATSQGQLDDINAPMVAVIVSLSAALLAVTIVSLQAWFYNADEAERTSPRKNPAQFSYDTPLGKMVQKQTTELQIIGWNDRPGMGEANKIRRIPIEQAMDLTVQSYALNR